MKTFIGIDEKKLIDIINKHNSEKSTMPTTCTKCSVLGKQLQWWDEPDIVGGIWLCPVCSEEKAMYYACMITEGLTKN